ncbi:hypothetical protein F4801DRAFT_277746 [Xylaria longipes]|nr:hypothetical protein F4801DRAFT_277746 [Xylaria longipes]
MRELDDHHGHEDEGYGVAATDNELNPYTRMSRYEEGREIIEVPLCVFYAMARENDDDTALSRKRIEVANGRPVTTIAPAGTNQLGGDSSMDIPLSSPIPPLDEDGDETTIRGSIRPGETIAKLHIRRSRRDPRFAELEGVIPLDSAVQISMDLDHPFHTHTHMPTPSRPPPAPARRRLPWLRSRNQNEEEEEEEKERPASVLDAHFPLCCVEKTARSYVGETLADEPRLTEANIMLDVNFHVHRLTNLVGRDSHGKGITGVQDPGFDPEPADTESLESTTLAEPRLSPPPVGPALATTGETPMLLPSRLTEEEDKHSSTDTDADTDTADTNTHSTNTKAEPSNDTISEKKPEAKGKSVAWDSTVTRGETESDPDPESESSHESYEREPDYYTQRTTPWGDPRKRPPTSVQRETPAQSKGYIDLYHPDEMGKRDDTPLASLAMPGRRHDRRVGRGRGAVCSKCGHWE